MTLAPSTLEADVRLHGVLEAAEEVVINVEFSAPVVRVLVHEGHAVSKGQPLVELDTTKLSLNLEQSEHLLEQARVELDNARLDLSRLQTLAEKNTVAEQRYDDARFAYELAVARVRELESRMRLIRRDLDKRLVTSPIEAVVGARHVEAGQSIVPHQPLMTLHTIQSLRVSAYIGEKHLPYVHVGNRARVQTASGIVATTIHSISAVSDPQTGNYEIKLLLENPDARFKPGMTADVLVRASPLEGVLVIPESALLAWKGSYVVYVANGRTAERRPVGVSFLFADRVVADHGLRRGDQLIVGGAQNVTDGSPVQPSRSARP